MRWSRIMDSLLPEHRGRTGHGRPGARAAGPGCGGTASYRVRWGREEARSTENDRTARATCGRTERKVPCPGMYPAPRPVAKQFRAVSRAVILGPLPLQELHRAAQLVQAVHAVLDRHPAGEADFREGAEDGVVIVEALAR